MTALQHLRSAFSSARGPLSFMFFLGYQRFELSRPVRRMIAGSGFHRAWLHGFNGWWFGKVTDRERWGVIECPWEAQH